MEIEKYCGNCGHYQHGQIKDPCSINAKYVGYLREGCSRWTQEEEQEESVRNSRVCRKCGQLRPLRDFVPANGYVCKDCKIKKKRRTY